MSKYVIIHGQLHEISDDELMHWKYLKREKVNGKWKYYYDWNELKSDTKTFLNDPTGRKRKKNLDRAEKELRDATNTIENRKMRSPDYSKAINEIRNAKARGTAYVAKGFLEETAAIDLDKQAEARKRLDEAKNAYSKTAPAKIEKAKDSANGIGEGIKQKTQDILGYDERNYKDYAYEMREKTESEIKKANYDYFHNNYVSVSTDEGFKKLMDHRTRVSEIEGKYDKWAEEYIKAKADYMKTPLGMIEATGDAVESAIWWVEDLFTSRRKKR